MNFLEILNTPQTVLVDVRSPLEFESGHLRGAINIPLDQFTHRYHEIADLGSKPVVFYCRSGNRIGQAVAFLRQKGIDQVYNGGALDELQHQLN